MVAQTQQALKEGEEYVIRTQIPEIMHHNEVEYYKLKEEYET